jgi:hypothetical protein
MLKPSLYELTKTCGFKDGVYFATQGPLDAPQRLWLSTATHGQEIAGPIALAELMRQDWIWPNVQMVATLSDPYGYKEEGYGFSSIEGDESCWPPLWAYRMDGKGYWNHYDRNSLWGNTDLDTVPLSHHAERTAMAALRPTFVLSLHETVRSEVERDLFWAGAGILVLETWPISAAEVSAARSGTKSPVAAAYGLLRGWIESALGRPQYIRAARALRGNPYYQTVSEIVSRYEQSGQEVTGDEWMKYLAMSMSDDIFVGPGRILHGPAMAEAEWYTIMDYALAHFGCPGITTETFPTGTMGLRGIEERVAQQLAFVESTLDVLDVLGARS